MADSCALFPLLNFNFNSFVSRYFGLPGIYPDLQSSRDRVETKSSRGRKVAEPRQKCLDASSPDFLAFHVRFHARTSHASAEGNSMNVARRRGCHAFRLRPVLVSATASLRAALRDAVVALVRLSRRGIQREYRPVSFLGSVS